MMMSSVFLSSSGGGWTESFTIHIVERTTTLPKAGPSKVSTADFNDALFADPNRLSYYRNLQLLSNRFPRLDQRIQTKCCPWTLLLKYHRRDVVEYGEFLLAT